MDGRWQAQRAALTAAVAGRSMAALTGGGCGDGNAAGAFKQHNVAHHANISAVT